MAGCICFTIELSVIRTFVLRTTHYVRLVQQKQHQTRRNTVKCKSITMLCNSECDGMALRFTYILCIKETQDRMNESASAQEQEPCYNRIYWSNTYI